MNRDIFLWIAIAGLAAIVVILSLMLIRRKKTHPISETRAVLDDNEDLPELVDEKTIIQISNELAFTVTLVDKTWFQFPKRIRYFIYPYVYLHDYISNKKWGEHSDQYVVDLIYSSLNDKEKYGIDEFDSVMHRTVLLRLMASSKHSFPGQIESDIYIHSVIHYQDLIDDTISDAVFFFTREADDLADEYGVTKEAAERIYKAENVQFLESNNLKEFAPDTITLVFNLIFNKEVDKLAKYVSEDVLTRK